MILHEQKVLLHADRIWGGVQYPACAEIHPTSFCPHDCVWCYNKEEREANQSQMNVADVERILPEMIARGLKAVQITGGGEPLVYPNIHRLFDLCNRLNLDVALETNGELLSKAIPHLGYNWKYVRISLDAYDSESYVKTRSVTKRRNWAVVYDEVMENLYKLIRMRLNLGYKYRIVIGYVVHGRNYDQERMIRFFDDCEAVGVDLIQMRPDFTDSSSTRFVFDDVMNAARSYKNLKITVSTKAVRPYGYGCCYGSMLNTVLYYTNKLAVCCMQPNLVIGDLSEPFDVLWERAMRQIPQIETDECPPCRFHYSNVLLNKLVHEDNHINML